MRWKESSWPRVYGSILPIKSADFAQEAKVATKDDGFITVREAADLLDCSIYSIYKLIRRGQVDFKDVGLGTKQAIYRVDREQIEAIAAERDTVRSA